MKFADPQNARVFQPARLHPQRKAWVDEMVKRSEYRGRKRSQSWIIDMCVHYAKLATENGIDVLEQMEQMK